MMQANQPFYPAQATALRHTGTDTMLSRNSVVLVAPARLAAAAVPSSSTSRLRRRRRRAAPAPKHHQQQHRSTTSAMVGTTITAARAPDDQVEPCVASGAIAGGSYDTIGADTIWIMADALELAPVQLDQTDTKDVKAVGSARRSCSDAAISAAGSVPLTPKGRLATSIPMRKTRRVELLLLCDARMATQAASSDGAVSARPLIVPPTATWRNKRPPV